MKFQEFWQRLNPTSQNILLFLRDALFFVVKFYILTWIVMLPVAIPLYFLKAFSPSAIASLNKLPFPQSLFLIVPFAIYLWCAVSFLLAEMSGWRKLAQRFRAPQGFAESQLFEGQLFSRQSGAFGVVGYNHVLNIRVSPKGLYLACIFLFRIGHSPLLIPWSEINSFKQRQFLWQKSARFKVGMPKIVTITLSDKKVVEAIALHVARD